MRKRITPADDKRAIVFIFVSTVVLGGLSLLAPHEVGQIGDIVNSGGDIAKGLFIIGITFAGYFLPSIVAKSRGHHQTLAIILLNLFLGWTVLGWIAALIWAATAIPVQPAKEIK